MELYELTIHEARELLAAGEITSTELTESVLNRIDLVDPRIRAYITLTKEGALEQASEADKRLAAGESTPLLGIPMAIKDVLCTEGVQTTCGSRILEGFIPPYTGTAVKKLEEAGMVMLGKTNTDEFAMGSSTENSGYFVTHNPWNTDYVPGGSSGGSAAAVAANECLGALGTDTGGSVRQPASYCGVVGIKPTYGRISRYGLVAFASSLDQIGAITKDVRDAALLLGTMAGYDPKDSTSIDRPVPNYEQALSGKVEGMRFGVPREYFVEGMNPVVETAVRDALGVLKDLGAEIVDISMPHTEYALPVYYLLAPAEASANLARYDGIRYGFSAPDINEMWDTFRKTREQGLGPEVKRRIMLGTYALSTGYYDAYYLKAQKVRTLIKQDYDQALEQCDAILVPTAPNVAFRIGEKMDDPLEMYLSDIFTLSLNLAGVCGISIPCGFDNGLPIGLQIMGGAFQEETILRVADAYEKATDWHKKQPAL